MAAFGRLLRAELLKLWSVPHIPWAAAGTFVVATAAAAAVAWAHAAGAAGGVFTDPAPGVVAGYVLPVVQVGASVVGVLAGAGEYDGRQIDATLTATPRRVRLLTAKVIAGGLTLLATSSLALAGMLAGTSHWNEAASWAAAPAGGTTGVLGTLRDLVLIGLLGSAIALLSRSLVGPLAVMLVLLLVAPHVLAALSVRADLLPGQGSLPSLLVWTTVAWAAAATRFCRLDA